MPPILACAWAVALCIGATGAWTMACSKDLRTTARGAVAVVAGAFVYLWSTFAYDIFYDP